jgi:hypothetical protein
MPPEFCRKCGERAGYANGVSSCRFCGWQETEFLVDRHKHRIVKRDGVWKLYCPERGGDSLILTARFADIVHAFTLPCSESGGGLIPLPYSHGLPKAFKITGTTGAEYR